MGVGGQQGPDRRAEAADALQGLLQAALLPSGLGGVVEGLQAAAATVVGQDARGAPALGRGREHPLQLANQMAAGHGLQAHLHGVAGQGAADEHHLAVVAPHPLAVMAQIGDLQLQLFAHRGHVRSLPLLRPYRGSCKGALHLAPEARAGALASIGFAGLWSLL